MKDRTVLGHDGDARDITAAAQIDPRATERIVEACDWRWERMRDGGRIAAALRSLKPRQRRFASKVLRGATWQSMGLPKSTFYRKLKIIEDFFSPENKGPNRHSWRNT